MPNSDFLGDKRLGNEDVVGDIIVSKPRLVGAARKESCIAPWILPLTNEVLGGSWREKLGTGGDVESIEFSGSG